MKKLSLVFIIAFVCTLCVAWIVASPGHHWLDSLIFPCIWIGALASGNMHQPNEAVVWSSLFLVFFAIGYFGLALGSFLLKRQSHNGQAQT